MVHMGLDLDTGFLQPIFGKGTGFERVVLVFLI